MPNDNQTFEHLLETIRLLDGDEPNPNSTIKPPPVQIDSLGRGALGDFRRVQANRGQLVRVQGETLGKGGMGIVRLATQTSLSREVALKTLQPKHADERHALQLLREGRVTARLQHPNVVPVHDAGIDDDGVPFLLLKRIVGQTWTELMHEPGALEEQFGALDALGWNIRTLQAVCNAVRAAHEAGVVHRDIKPDNVMVGPVGEVYLLDWGIATASGDPASRAVAGTPAYMAPEMLQGRADARTDVFLLGAVLYQILTGRAPHAGGELRDVLGTVERCAPQPPADGPPELVALCMEALARDPDLRIQTAARFGEALQAFLEHRISALLAEQARSAAARMVGASTSDRRRLFAEAHFGFRQALSQGPDPALQHETSHLVQAMVDFELEQGALERARDLHDQLDNPPPELTDRVVAAEAELEADRRRGEAAVRDADPGVAMNARMSMSFAVGFSLALMPSIAAPLLGVSPTTLRFIDNHVATLFFLALVLVLGWGFRRSVSSTALNRRSYLVLLTVPVGEVVLSVGAQAVGIQPVETLMVQFLWLAGCGAFAAASIDGRLIVLTFAYLVSFLGSLWMPFTLFWWLSFGNLVFALTVVWMWRR